MKKILLFLLIAVLALSGCSTDKAENNNSEKELATFQEELLKENKLFAIAYIGSIEGSFKKVKNTLKKSDYMKDYAFLSDIDEEKFYETEGNETYAIIPVDKDAIITVSKYGADEQLNFYKADELGKITDGKPVIVRGNLSDFIPNIIISAEKGSKSTEITPVLSMQDGQMHIMNELVKDFSIYK